MLFIPSPAAPIPAPVRKTTTNVRHTLLLSFSFSHKAGTANTRLLCFMYHSSVLSCANLSAAALFSALKLSVGQKRICTTSAWNIKTTPEFQRVCWLLQFTMKTKASATSPWPQGPGGDKATAGYRDIRPSSLTGKLWLYCLPLNSAKTPKSFIKALSLKVFAVKIHRAK